MHRLWIVLGAGLILVLALASARKAWGQTGVVPPFSTTETTLPIPSVTTVVPNANVTPAPVLILPAGTDRELVLQAIAALRGTPAIIPESAIVNGNTNASGGTIDVTAVNSNVTVAAPVVPPPSPPPRVLKDPPMRNPSGNPKTISLF